MSRLADVVRIFHHVSQQRAKDGIVEIVHRAVPLADLDRHLGIALDEGIEDIVNHCAGDPGHFRKQRQRFDLPTFSISGTRLAMFFA